MTQALNLVPTDVQAALPVPKPNMDRLIDILTLKRCHCSVGERKLVEQILEKYEPKPLIAPEVSYNYTATTTTSEANPIVMAYVITRAMPDGTEPKVLWSCHVDTVHKLGADSKQLILHDESTNLIYKQDGEPLGADDGAGVWLLLEMIDAGVPGTYIFHRGEEKGGIGSRAVAAHHADFVSKHTHAIAFDRRDSCSIITRQSRGKCCSDKWAQHFADMINDKDYTLKPDPTGTFTDTANYISLIGECTNVSIGYHNEHGGNEILDLEYLLWLREKMIAIDVEKLASVSERKAGEVEPASTYSGGYWQGGRFHSNKPSYSGGYSDEARGGFDFGDLGDNQDDIDWFARTYPHLADQARIAGTLPPKGTTKKPKVKGKSGISTTPPKVQSTTAVLDPKTHEDVLNMKVHELKTWIGMTSSWKIIDLLSDLAMTIEKKDLTLNYLRNEVKRLKGGVVK